ncbi:hypothetical protein ACJJTC_013634 [Scirpophaga incertulas]
MSGPEGGVHPHGRPLRRPIVRPRRRMLQFWRRTRCHRAAIITTPRLRLWGWPRPVQGKGRRSGSLSPDEWTVVGGARKRPIRMTVSKNPVTGSLKADRSLRLEGATAAPEYATPHETTTSDDEDEGVLDLCRTSANAASKSIVTAAGASNKINKADLASINGDLALLMEIVSHLGMISEQQRAEIVTLRTTVSEREDVWQKERRRVAEAEAAATSARAEVLAATRAMEAAATAMGSNIKNSEEVKNTIKTSVASAKLGIHIEKVRRVGNSGVVIQTRTTEDLAKLKAALPDSLKASDLRGRQPLVVIRDLEGKDPDFRDTMAAIHVQNFVGDKEWSLEKMLAGCRLAFRKSRQGSPFSAMVIACTPELRRALVNKGRLYVRWESCRVEDFTTAICCNKCCMYGHSERKCKQEGCTCSRCGAARAGRQMCEQGRELHRHLAVTVESSCYCDHSHWFEASP